MEIDERIASEPSPHAAPAAAATEPAGPEVTPTEPGDADLLDFGSGQRHRVPRAYGFRGDGLLQIREPDSPSASR